MYSFYKLNISIPSEVKNLLLKDAELFEIYKKDGRINTNKFLIMLIEGYYEKYISEQREIASKINKVLQKYGISGKTDDITSSIIENVILPNVPTRNTKAHSSISLKPSKSIEPLITQMLNNINPTESISHYFSRMFISYSEKPLPEREKLIFHATYEKLLSVCSNHQEISFVTNKEPHRNHEVIPYTVAIGQDESFNYLLCSEYNDYTNTDEAIAYRINRIKSIFPVHTGKRITAEVEDHLNKMLYYGAQYSINSDIEIIVKLSKKGIESYKRYYYGRPIASTIDELDDGSAIYHFRCSENQVFLYFRRFQNDDATIISPKHLRDRVIDFHKGVLEKAYKIGGKKDE